MLHEKHMDYLHFSSVGHPLIVPTLQMSVSKLFQQLVTHKASSDHVTISLDQKHFVEL